MEPNECTCGAVNDAHEYNCAWWENMPIAEVGHRRHPHAFTTRARSPRVEDEHMTSKDSPTPNGASEAFVNHNGQQIDLGTLRSRMDGELVRRLEAEGNYATSGDNQGFFDAYLKAHQEKYGKAFSV